MALLNRMRWKDIGRLIFRMAICVAAVLAVTALLDAMPLHDRPLSVALTCLFLVLVVSAAWGFRYAVFIACVATVAFSWLAPAFRRFQITDPRDAFALASFLAVGITGSYLSERARREACNANQRRAEAVAAQKRFRDLVNSVEGIVWEIDAETFNFSFVSSQAERILGYPAKSWLEIPTFWQDHIHPCDRDWVVRTWRECMAGNHSQDFEYRMMAADGRVVWMRDLVTVVTENGRATRLRGVMVDISRRKRNEEALREQANLLNLTHDAIFVRDMTGAIKYWNHGAEELYGWGAEQAKGKSAHELLKTIFLAPFPEIEEELMHSGRWEGELVHTKKFGTPVIVASRWSLQRDERGRPVAVLETNNDITERKRAEQEREKLRDMEADLARMNRIITIGALTGSLAHEVNQPIAAAVTNANTCVRWLAGEAPNIEEARDAARRMVKDANRAADIIARVRALFMKSSPRRELADLNEVIREMVSLVRSEAVRHGISIRSEVAPGLPPVMADRIQVQQVLMNLIMNSIEAMKGVNGARELTLASQPDGGDQVVVSISDTGVGLPRETDRIFDAFFTTKSHGTGMGLAISRTIVESYGGRMWAAPNNPGPGAVFYFTLPALAATPQ